MAVRAYIKFTNIDVPQYSLIEDAYVEFTAYSNLSGNLDVGIYVYDQINPSVPTDKTELDNISVSAGISWSITEDWSIGETYNSPSLSASIQDLVNDTNWSTGSSIMVIIENENTGGVTNKRDFRSFEYNNIGARLIISHSDPIEISDPYFDPSAGIISSGDQVEIKTLSPGNPNIYYTDDGTDPSINDNLLYTGSITITENKTFNTIAGGNGYTLSSIVSASYIIPLNPPTGTWTLLGSLSDVSVGNISDEIIISYAETDEIYVGTHSTKNMYIFSETNNIWSWQDLPAYQVPSTRRHRTLTKFNGDFYMAYDNIFDKNIHRYDGSNWVTDGSFSRTIKAAAPHGNYLYLITDHEIWKRDTAGNWTLDYTLPGYYGRTIRSHGGYIWAIYGDLVYRKEGGTWYQRGGGVSRSNDMGCILSASDGNLYGSATLSSPVACGMYRWEEDTLTWTYLGETNQRYDNETNALGFYNGKLYIGGWSNIDGTTNDYSGYIDTTNLSLGDNNFVYNNPRKLCVFTPFKDKLIAFKATTNNTDVYIYQD